MAEALSPADVTKMLAQACAQIGSQRAWADRHGFSPQYVCDVLSGRRDPSEAIANNLGLIRKIAYYPARNVKA